MRVNVRGSHRAVYFYGVTIVPVSPCTAGPYPSTLPRPDVAPPQPGRPTSSWSAPASGATRRTLAGEPAGRWFPEARGDVETALRACTANSAWTAGAEAIRDLLAPGMLADLVAPDRDPITVPASELRTLAVQSTIVGGRVVYSR